MLFLATIFNLSIKKLGPGPAKVPKHPKNPFIEDKSFNTLILELLGLWLARDPFFYIEGLKMVIKNNISKFH